MERTLKIILTLSGSRILKGMRKLWNVAWDLAVSVGEVCGSWRSQDRSYAHCLRAVCSGRKRAADTECAVGCQ